MSDRSQARSRSQSQSPIGMDRGRMPSTEFADNEERKQRTDDGPPDAERTSAKYRNPSDEVKRNRSPDSATVQAKPKRKDAGFKWKERRRDDPDKRERDETLRRGYKDIYQPQSRPRPRSRSRSRSPRRIRDSSDTYRERRRDQQPDATKKEKKESKPSLAAPPPQQEMIIVYVNDRLGTKKAIPCFPTDPIKDFKVIVASMIGRQPHEILLKRQGERPFKDMLTLQDYGVSNNVQLDLEVDTGD